MLWQTFTLETDKWNTWVSILLWHTILMDSVSDLLDYINPGSSAKGRDAILAKRKGFVSKVQYAQDVSLSLYIFFLYVANIY